MQIVSFVLIRGPLWPLLFFVLFFSPVHAQDLKDADRLSMSPTWHSLLHLHKNKNDVSDPAFYIRGKFTDAKSELLDDYRAFYIDHNRDLICHFPARALWLQQTLSLPPVDFSNCTELNRFMEKAPMEKVSVVFASENLTSPTSMMGHIFLKIEGLNQKGEHLEHAISFFTNVQNVSFPELAFKSLITGMKGYYALSPYSGQKNAYLYNEQRNIWEYELPLSQEQKTLLQYHLYELKPIAFTYLFHAFNCATLIDNIIALPYPQIKDDRGFWVTPLDVVRSMKKYDLIADTHVYPASKWMIKSLQESYDFDDKSLSLMKKQDYHELAKAYRTSESQFLNMTLARSYNNYLFEEEAIPYQAWSSSEAFLKDKKQAAMSESELDLSKFKKPADTIQDSQLITGYMRRKNKNLFCLGLLPASHGLEDDTSQYNNESELKLGEVIFSYNSSDKHFRVDQVTAYSAASFNPNNALTGGLSGKFNIGYGPRPFDHSYYFEGGIGKTWRMKRDVDLYLLADGGIRLKNKFHLYGSPETGAIIREIWKMKSIFSYSKVFTTGESYSSFDQFKFTQAINLGDYAIDLEWLKANHDNSYALLLKKNF